MLIFEAISLLCCSILLTIAAVEDWKSSTVSGIVCLICWIASFASLFLWNFNPVILVVVSLMCILFYIAGPESPFGSADLLPLAMFLATFVSEGFYSPAIFMFPVSLLILLFPYGKLYGRTHGIEWSLGSRIYMPMLPCMAAGWWISSISYILFNIIKS